MRATVVAMRANQTGCDARSDNDLMFVFALPAGVDIRLGHELEINPAVINAQQTIRNLTTGQDIAIVLKDNDVHDLRMPVKHGGSRFPSRERLGGA